MLRGLKRGYRKARGDQNFSEILSGSVLAIMGRVMGTGMTLVASAVVARLYGAAATGVLAEMNSFLILASILTVLGTDTSILRMIPEHIARYSVRSAFAVYRKVLSIVICISLGAGALGAFASEGIANYIFSKPHLSSVFALASLCLVLRSVMQLCSRAVRGLMLTKTFALYQALPPVNMLVILLGITVLSRNDNAPVLAQLAAYGVTALIGVGIMEVTFSKRVGSSGRIHMLSLNSLASVSLPMLLTSSMQFFVAQAGVLLLGVFRSDEEVGYYSIAAKLATMTVLFLQAVNAMAAPKFSELHYSGKRDALIRLGKQTARLVFWASAPVPVGLLVLGGPLLQLVWGADFLAGYPAMAILVVGQIVNAACGCCGHFLNMTGNQRVLSRIMLVASVLNVGMGVVLIPKLGCIGAAIAGACSVAYLNVHAAVEIKARFGVLLAYFPGLSRSGE